MFSPRTRIGICIGAAILLVAPLAAAERRTRKAEGTVGTVLDSAVVAANVDKLARAVAWVDSFDEARRQAQREEKMILWIHALGELDGLT